MDQQERFTFKPLLYELLNGGANEAEVAPSFAQLTAPYPIRFVQVRAAGKEGVGGERHFREGEGGEGGRRGKG